MALLSDFEASLVPSAVPQLSRAAATQLAGCALDAREQLGRGIPWAEAQTRVANNVRHAQQLARWGQTSTWLGLTGP